MKYLTGIVLFLLIEAASAAECRVNGGAWYQFTSWSYNMDIPVTVRRVPGTNITRLDGYTLECRYSSGGGGGSSAKDYWKTYGGAMNVGPKLRGLGVGATLNGTDYHAPLPTHVDIATAYNDGRSVSLKAYAFALNTGKVNFVAGDPLITIPLTQKSSQNAGIPLVRFNLYAANNLPPDISTCTINNNSTIDVNFNQVNQTAIGETPTGTPITKSIQLNYSCPQAGMTMPITIGLRGTAASFNSGVLAMSNTNLGTGVMRAGVLVRPGQSFTTNLSNSSGRDTVTFALIRKAGTVPSVGAFSGSATLVMGIP